MAKMSISLSDVMKDWIDAHARNRRMSTASDYIRELVSHEHEREQDYTELQALITEGKDSGASDQSMADILARVRA